MSLVFEAHNGLFESCIVMVLAFKAWWNGGKLVLDDVLEMSVLALKQIIDLSQVLLVLNILDLLIS